MSTVMELRALPAAIGEGLVAGAAGTAAMTLSSTLEMKARGREPSDAPARAAAKVLGVDPTGESERRRFATLTHWGYGTSWGIHRDGLAIFLPLGSMLLLSLVGSLLLYLLQRL
jgi:hypothetical protein